MICTTVAVVTNNKKGRTLMTGSAGGIVIHLDTTVAASARVVCHCGVCPEIFVCVASLVITSICQVVRSFETFNELFTEYNIDCLIESTCKTSSM
jgi:hypothetical protein